jgi:hypothetical protein
MEAKGCAKPAVWKDARRKFYWAVRARVARSAALADLTEASPSSTSEYRSRLLDSLASIDATMEDRQVAETLEKLDLSQTVSQLKGDYLIRRMIELTKEDRKAALSGLTRLADNLSDEERNSLISVLQNATRSPGMFVLFNLSVLLLTITYRSAILCHLMCFGMNFRIDHCNTLLACSFSHFRSALYSFLEAILRSVLSFCY